MLRLKRGSKRDHNVVTSVCNLRFDGHTGDLLDIHWKSPRLSVIADPRLGENFQILAPAPRYQANYFNSKRQRVARFEPLDDGVACIYERLVNDRETLDIAVRYTVQVVDGQLTFRISVDNRTDYPLAEVCFGMIGGQTGIGNRRDTKAMATNRFGNPADGLFQKISGGAYGGGNLGIRHAAWGWTYPGGLSMPWLSIYNPKRNQAIYYANHDVQTRLSALHFELRPYTIPANPNDVWPLKLPATEPRGLTMGWMNMPHVHRGVFEAGPVVLQVHSGDWHEAAMIYRRWFDQHFSLPQKPNWLRREHAWQSIILSNCEDVIVHKFKDLPRLAADAKAAGITTFEILGWDQGGIDRGYPEYTTDERLGSKKSFESALQKIRATGVHPIIFANVQVADTATPAWKKELHRYAVHGRWAPDLILMGWGEGTHSARMNLTRSNMTLVSPAHAAFRKRLVKQLQDLIRGGADGVQLDKTTVNGVLDFNPNLPAGITPDRSMTAALLDCFQEIVGACQRENPDFALASEIWWDRAIPWAQVSYMRLGALDMPSPGLRYTFPEWTATIFAENPSDFIEFNNAMRYGMVFAVAACHYNASAADPLTQPLMRYLKELLRIRRKHEDVLFLGRYLDTRGASVRTSSTSARYSMFENLTGSVKAAVLANHGDSPETAIVDIDGVSRRATLLQPFERDRKIKLPLKLKIPAQRCAVVVATAK